MKNCTGQLKYFFEKNILKFLLWRDPFSAKVRKTGVAKEEGEYFTVNPKKLPPLDAEFNGDYVTAINHGLIP